MKNSQDRTNRLSTSSTSSLQAQHGKNINHILHDVFRLETPSSDQCHETCHPPVWDAIRLLIFHSQVTISNFYLFSSGHTCFTFHIHLTAASFTALLMFKNEKTTKCEIWHIKNIVRMKSPGWVRWGARMVSSRGKVLFISLLCDIQHRLRTPQSYYCHDCYSIYYMQTSLSSKSERGSSHTSYSWKLFLYTSL